jgi:Fe2+ transport system protein FeoA
MKHERRLHRRMMEIGILPGQPVTITRHKCGCILKVRHCTYVMGEDAIDIVREIVGEI